MGHVFEHRSADDVLIAEFEQLRDAREHQVVVLIGVDIDNLRSACTRAKHEHTSRPQLDYGYGGADRVRRQIGGLVAQAHNEFPFQNQMV